MKRNTQIVFATLLTIAMSGCQDRPHRYCFPNTFEEDGGYFYEKDGGFFYERDGGYFTERDGGYFYEKDGGYLYERDGVSYALICRGGVRCKDYDSNVQKCTADVTPDT